MINSSISGKIGTYLTSLLVLISISFSTLSYGQNECKEQKVGRSYLSICSEQIKTEKKKLVLTTSAVPKKIENKNTYKLVHYYVYDRKKTETDEVFLEYSKLLKNLESLTCYINGREFSGILKLAVAFKNEGKDTLYDGYDLFTFEFKEGKFVSKEKALDVELEKEKPVVR